MTASIKSVADNQTINVANETFDELGDAGFDTRSIRPAMSYVSSVIDSFNGKDAEETGDCLPWHKTHNLFRYRPGEVTIVAAINGHRKSTTTGQVMLPVLAKGTRVAIASWEMSPTKSLKRLARQAIGNSHPTDQYLERFLTKFAGDRLWYWDQLGSVPPKRVLGFVRYCMETMKCKHVVLDSLMKIDLPESGYDAADKQKEFVNSLCSLAKAFNGHIHLVTHITKASNRFDELNRSSVYGTGRIVDQADNLIILWDNKDRHQEKRKPENMRNTKIMDMPDFMLSIQKQRNGEFEGDVQLWLHEDSLQLVEYETARPVPYVE